jgi:hypothetical protein
VEQNLVPSEVGTVAVEMYVLLVVSAKAVGSPETSKFPQVSVL